MLLTPRTEKKSNHFPVTNFLNGTSAVPPQEKWVFFFTRNVTYASHKITNALGISWTSHFLKKPLKVKI